MHSVAYGFSVLLQQHLRDAGDHIPCRHFFAVHFPSETVQRSLLFQWLLLPWHRIQDILEEDRLARSGSAFGSTRRGIAYAYSDKYRTKTLRLGDLLHLEEESVQSRLKVMLDAKNMELAGCYHQEPMSFPALLLWCRSFCC